MDDFDDWDAAFGTWRAQNQSELERAAAAQASSGPSQDPWDEFLDDWERENNPAPPTTAPLPPAPAAARRGRPKGYTGGLLGMAILRRVQQEPGPDLPVPGSVEHARQARMRNVAAARILHESQRQDPDDIMSLYLERSPEAEPLAVASAGSVPVAAVAPPMRLGLLDASSCCWGVLQSVAASRPLQLDLVLAAQRGVQSSPELMQQSAEAAFLVPGQGGGIFRCANAV